MRQQYPDHEAQLSRLSRIEGQIGGLRRMIAERRYCIDILHQIKAVTGALKQVEMGVLETHIQHCVKEAAAEENPELLAERVEELVHVLGRLE